MRLRAIFRTGITLTGILLSASVGWSQLTSPSNQWTPTRFANGTSTVVSTDPSVDQQTGQRESDIVGNSTNASFFTTFHKGSLSSLTDGTMFFRVRLSEDTQGDGYSGYMWIGVDADLNGDIDIFIGANRQGNNSNKWEIGLHDPGTGLNISPNTTSIVSNPLISSALVASPAAGANYDWQTVTSTNNPGGVTDVDANGTDYYMSFSLPFQSLVNQLGRTGVNININENTPLSYVLATSQQGNAINQDVNGASVNSNSTTTWTQLGVVTTPTSMSSVAIPEPSTLALIALPLLGFVRVRRPARSV
jgi:hypothetical protein